MQFTKSTQKKLSEEKNNKIIFWEILSWCITEFSEQILKEIMMISNKNFNFELNNKLRCRDTVRPLRHYDRTYISSNTRKWNLFIKYWQPIAVLTNTIDRAFPGLNFIFGLEKNIIYISGKILIVARSEDSLQFLPQGLLCVQNVCKHCKPPALTIILKGFEF